jgi:predicted MPP superfamily phosphohydrolase
VKRRRIAIAVVVVAALAIWSGYIEPRRLVVHEETLVLPGWSAALDGLRVVALSDLHVGNPYMDVARLRAIVARTNALAPDLIVLLGDFVTLRDSGHYVEPEVIAPELAALHARLGVFAVLGNHEPGRIGRRMRAALEHAGIAVLDQRCVVLPGPLALAGVADVLTRDEDPAGAIASCADHAAPILMITHNPDVFPEVDARVSLTLAGHTHGGQVRLPLIGPLIVPSRYGRRYAAGHIVENGRHLFVTTGAGSSHLPLRFGVPPEIALLTLRR